MVTSEVTPLHRSLVPCQVLASDLISRGGNGIFRSAGKAHESTRKMFNSRVNASADKVKAGSNAAKGALIMP